MKLLLNLIVLMKNPTRTVPLSCSYLGIISHYGPQICQKREVIIVTNLYLWLALGILRILLTYLCFQIILILLVVVSVAEEFKVWCIWVSENKRFLAFVVKLNIGHCLCWMHFSNLLTFGGNRLVYFRLMLMRLQLHPENWWFKVKMILLGYEVLTIVSME